MFATYVSSEATISSSAWPRAVSSASAPLSLSVASAALRQAASTASSFILWGAAPRMSARALVWAVEQSGWWAAFARSSPPACFV